MLIFLFSLIQPFQFP